MPTIRTTWLVLPCCLLGAMAAGCGSNQAYPYDVETVWNATVGESIAWRPDRIDGGNYLIEAHLKDMRGQEVDYLIQVHRDWNLFNGLPSTRVFVNIEQAKPTRLRFYRLEREFLARLQDTLSELTARTPPAVLP